MKNKIQAKSNLIVYINIILKNIAINNFPENFQYSIL